MHLLKHVQPWKRASQRAMTHQYSSQSVSRAALPSLSYSEDLFNYTRCRSVCNERHEMSQRYVRFNVNELARRAAEAVGTRTCIGIEKYPDGMYNKSMLLTMDDGSQVVAKVPNPNAGRPHFTTASEVATMDFMRNVLGTPVPRVLAWSSRAYENTVGAEYIIMEKAQGIELERVWPSMNTKDRLTVVKEIAGFQAAWTSVSFTKFGSLYFAQDLEEFPGDEPLYVSSDGVEVTDKRFAVGPSTGRETIDHGRSTIEFDRGPWNSLKAYHAAIGRREIACISQLPELPKSPISLCGPGTYLPTREKKLAALKCYLEILEVLLPTDRTISSANLWHADLHVANIFVDPSEPTKVSSVIDWQATEISPLYIQARQPQIIDYDGPPVTGVERPQPHQDLTSPEPDVRQRAEALYIKQCLCSLYNILTSRKNPRLWAALQFQDTDKFTLLLLARNLLIDGEATYLAKVAELESTWEEIDPNSPFPFSFTDKEREDMEADAEGAARGMDIMRSVKEALGELFPEQGFVKLDNYDEALDALAQVKEQIIDIYAKNDAERQVWERLWPFGT